MDEIPVEHDPFGSGDISRLSPSTEPQREVIAAAAMSQEANTAFNEAVSLRIDGVLDVDTVESALSTIVDRHDALRTTFTPQLDALVVTNENRFALERVDLSGEGGDEQARILLKTWHELSATPMALCDGPLFRAVWLQYSPGSAELVLLAHHAVCDGWSFHVILRELSALCGADSVVLPPASSFATFAEQQAARDDENRDAEFWLKRFADRPVALDLPTDGPRPARRTFAAGRVDHFFSQEATKAIAAASAEMRASNVAVLLAGVAALLHRLTDADDITLGLPVARQALHELPDLVGHCVQLLPIRLAIDDAQRFEQLVIQARSAVLDATEHYDFTFGGLVRGLGLSGDAARVPLIPVIVNVDQPLADLSLGEAVAKVRTVPRTAEGFEIFFNVLPKGSGWVIEATFNAGLFAADTIEAWLVALENLIVAGAADKATAVRSLRLAPDQSATYDSFNATDRAIARASWLEALAEHAELSPSAPAVTDAGGTMSYGEFVRRARDLAHELVRRGVRRGDTVGLFTGRSRHLLVAMTGIHLAGASHVPLDPDFPEARRQFQIEDSGAHIIVTDNGLAATVKPGGVDLLNIETDVDGGAADETLPVIASADLAYVIFTSGSTGKPKGVRLQHGPLANLLASVATRPGFAAGDTLVAITTIAFDISMLELLVPLTVGGCVVVATREESEDPGALASLLRRHNPTVMQATPATWRMLVDDQWGGSNKLRAFCGGERLPRDLAAALLPRVHSLWNLYGPTETCVWSAGAEVHDSATAALVGTPFDNTRIFILDRGGALLPPGMPGEICIGGLGLAEGYQNLPQLTAERFVEHLDLGRLYRTGDRGRLRPAGTLECLGRMDHQVKLRGFRIELGEIETLLGEHPGVSEAAVAVVENGLGSSRLIAFLVAGDELPSAGDLKDYLRGILPEYMVPQQLVSIPALPRLPNGKLDRRSLPSTMPIEFVDPSAFIAPETSTERIVVAEMCKILELDRVGVEQSFFDAGGHSLMAAQLVARLNRVCDVALTMRSVFEAPTPRQLAHAVISGTNSSRAATRRISRRSDQQVAPVTNTQERMWFMELMLAGRPTYNLPSAHRLVGTFDEVAFERAFQTIVDRQSVLRTTFERRDGQIRQIVHDIMPVDLLPVEDLSCLAVAQREQRLMARLQELAATPFDLNMLPLFRVQIFRLSRQEHVFFFMPHHIVWDGWSFDVLYEEMAAIYSAYVEDRPNPLSALPISYGDYAAWHRELLASPDAQRQTKVWRGRLAEFGVVQRLPVGRRGNVGMSGEGSTEWLAIDAARTGALHGLARDCGATLFVTTLALYTVLLHGYSRQSRLLLATPVRGRESADLESVMGCCNNLVQLPLAVSRDDTFESLVARVKSVVLDSFAYPDVLLEQVVADQPKGVGGSLSHGVANGVLYQALFSYQDVRRRNLRWGELEHSMIHLFQRGATEDLGLWFVEGETGLQGGLTYNSNALTRETVLKLRDGFRQLVNAVLANSAVQVGELVGRIEGVDARHGEVEPSPAAIEVTTGGLKPYGKVVNPGDVKDYEFVLLRIWQRVLARDQITVDENFFELGGNSLAAIQCVAEFELTTGITIDLGELFNSPTIALLSAKIGAGMPHRPAMVIPLQADGNGPPLFCLLGIQVYQHLATSFGKAHPSYGVYVREEQALVGGPVSERFGVASIDRLASAYCEVIRKACPSGPLHLAGLSFGGIVAMEVAKRLAKTGVQVESVMLLDTILPDGYRRHLLQRLRHSAAGAVGHIGALWRMASRLVSRRNNAAVNLADEHMVAAKASRPGLEMERQVSKWLLDLEPPSWPVVLLRASDNSVWGQGYELLEDYGWGRRLGDRLTVIRVDGDHLGILSTPHVNKLVAEVCALRKTWV